jgi:hypothetical protein
LKAEARPGYSFWDRIALLARHYCLMKISQVLPFACLALVVCSCHQPSTEAVPAGSFRLVVEDMVKDESFRVTSLKVLSSQPGMLSVSRERARSACELLIPAGKELREGQIFVTASKATDSRTTNAYILVNLQMKVDGGDGGMIGHASAQSGLGSTTFYPPKDTALGIICNLTAKSGVYPVDAPLEIGRVDDKPVILTVGKSTL